MAFKNAKNTFKRSICVQDVPLLLRIVLRVSQVTGAAPLRLRHARAGWILSVSRGAVVLQRIVLVVFGSCVLTALILDLLEENVDKRVFMGATDIANFLAGSEVVFLFLVHLFGVLSATNTIKSVMALLQQTMKMNCNNKLFKNVKYEKTKASMLITLIIWKILSNLAVVRRIGPKFHENRLLHGLFVPSIYQHLVTNMFQLQCSSTVVAINFVLTKINDQLEQLLIKTTIITKVYPNDLRNETRIFDDIPVPGTRIKDASAIIRQLAQYHGAICESIRKMNKTHGLFLVLSFMLISLRLLMTQFFFFSDIESNSSMLWLFNWTCLLLINTMVLVEPCHWLRDQMKRTRCLLSQIASRSGQSNELDLFILQAQTSNAMFAPMGIFVVARPLVASIIGGIFTYLVIVIQMLNAPEPL